MQLLPKTQPRALGLGPPAATTASLLDCTGTGLLAVACDGRITIANAAARHVLGIPADHDRLDLEAAVALSPSERARLRELVGGNLEGPLQFYTEFGMRLAITRRTAPDGSVLLSFEESAPAAPAAARTDALTGLADRHVFNERLAALCDSGSEVALLMIDLDRFKLVNDTLGHQAGDALLRLVGQRLRSTFRNADVVSRFGGDEFAIAAVAGPEATSIAERIVKVLSRPYLIEEQSAVVGASIGIAYAPVHGCDPVSLTRAADLALYQAKADGRGNVRVFNSELDRRARNRGTLAGDLRRAIPLRQLELHFQPQITLKTRELTGFEALVRWPHPELGNIPPDQFIPMAEEMGLIIPLGEWVLNEACEQAMTWPGHLTVAVNVSPKQLVDPERLPRTIAATLAKTGLPANRLEIEITETALVNEAQALAVLSKIRSTGVRISMDDFGTGYSSLSQLRRFPFDKIKIDRSFVRDLGGSAEASAVVRAIAALGQSLGMGTVAEGVETSDQEAICRDDGCSTMQGYLVSRPVPAGAVADLIDDLRIPQPT
ncbi:MAG: EAL domain-containing protein [Acetobacteraceae bacterium]|nr:EAL domain-containing protein [Acetobacteraceae bacterium]